MKFINLVKNEKWTIFKITGIIVSVVFLFTLILPWEYSASNRLLIIQPISINLDPYSASKAIERIGEKLANIIYTTSFYNKVLESNPKIDKTYFKQDEKSKRKQWRKMVESRVLRGTGMIEIVVYHKNKRQAQEIIDAITDVYTNDAWEYVGSVNLRIKEVDAPLVSKWPVRPNIILNLILGFVFGLIVSIGYVLFKNEENIVLDFVNRKISFLKFLDDNVDSFKVKSTIPKPPTPKSKVRFFSVNINDIK